MFSKMLKEKKKRKIRKKTRYSDGMTLDLYHNYTITTKEKDIFRTKAFFKRSRVAKCSSA